MNKYCGNCGTRFDNEDWPRVCGYCKQYTWLNPKPVVVTLHKVIDDRQQPCWRDGGLVPHRVGALVAKRAIDPGRGKWGLISGFMEVGETAEHAAAREFLEETSLEVESTPRYLYSDYNVHNQLMLFFIVDEPMSYEKFSTGKVCPENEELGVVWEEEELAFPVQSQFLSRWLKGDFRYDC